MSYGKANLPTHSVILEDEKGKPELPEVINRSLVTKGPQRLRYLKNLSINNCKFWIQPSLAGWMDWAL